MLNQARFSMMVFALAATPLPALAHAHPKSMTPAANATVSAPTELSVVFSEALEPKFSKLELVDDKGAVLSKNSSTVDPADHKHMTLPLPKLSAGVYHVHWVSAAMDGHRMDGEYSFTVK